ncbi:hypothetical protein GCK32_020104 [Trichostrongylus colubriformis]|uniref:Uncharacterized protein n=1 Tax=Trichostrongylus colubriformis TaxID=6319 RepID=A0AAN8F9S9_TRICO
MCANDFYEFQKPSTYTVILPTTYAPLTLPTISHGYPAWLDSESATTATTASSNTVPVSIPTKMPRAFPETGSFGSYGRAGLAC